MTGQTGDLLLLPSNGHACDLIRFPRIAARFSENRRAVPPDFGFRPNGPKRLLSNVRLEKTVAEGTQFPL